LEATVSSSSNGFETKLSLFLIRVAYGDPEEF
jgi:hypothetical protein